MIEEMFYRFDSFLEKWRK